ncbi:hypothetical protein PIIN_08884 [Serendipita indica DSM 11827]|uniref:Uncharacterized protein n=1 Tax=Serendipita indica (strain DSM 11827) TaxID=1109443 RepID=G4TUC1_SERID|nr:hypothetical protein PIIN_08884 [Serendipita indica DSM 11827]
MDTCRAHTPSPVMPHWNEQPHIDPLTRGREGAVSIPLDIISSRFGPHIDLLPGPTLLSVGSPAQLAPPVPPSFISQILASIRRRWRSLWMVAAWILLTWILTTHKHS